MSIRSVSWLRLLCALVVLSCSGCLMRRTVSEDGVVVSKSYVVKAPLVDTAN